MPPEVRTVMMTTGLSLLSFSSAAIPMPSRPVIVAIVAFWLLTAGWFAFREIMPFMGARDQPPFTIELADEAQSMANPESWTCTRNGRKIGSVRTFLTYQPKEDTFEFRAKSPEISFMEGVLARDYDDSIRVNRDGELRGMETAATLTAKGLTARVQLSAEVRGGRLERSLKVNVFGLGIFAPQLSSTDPPRGNILNPMHPVRRITGLHPGQTWRQPLLDPRMDIIRAAVDQLPLKVPFLAEPPKELVARVLPEPQPLDGNESVSCYVIEFRGDEDYIARTWVRVADGAVQRQEAGLHGEVIVLQRQ